VVTHYVLLAAILFGIGGVIYGEVQREARKHSTAKVELMQQKLQAAQKSADAHKRARGLLERRLEARAKVEAERQRALENALQGPAKEWAATEVPPEVRNAL
jgi:uncharacterized protein HemX